MAFPYYVVEEAWERADGHCECERVTHRNHRGGSCGKRLVWRNRGREGRGA